MDKFTNLLDNIEIASPCQANWDEMYGDNQQRHCGMCKLNVYNLSEMTKQEAENFLINAEGRTCIKFYRRADGTVLTQNCPVGWQAVKQKFSRTAKVFTSLCAGILGGVFAFNQFQTNPKTHDEKPAKIITTESIDVPTRLEDFEKTKDFPVHPKKDLDEKYQGSVGMLLVETKPVKSKKHRRR